MEPNEQALQEFQRVIWDYYQQHARSLPWRDPEPDGSFDPYKIMVSEIMLQQTQAQRVIPRYELFLGLFPSVPSLAEADLAEVLIAWSGLGYNRRAKFLWQAARQVMALHGGQLPLDVAELQQLPGIGQNTAAAIAAYAYNQPVVFVETNIRTVFIHHFFPEATDISDKQLIPLIEASRPLELYREWYWALMDYGHYLKSITSNPSRRSKHYARQSAFDGSLRQLRGAVIRELTGQAFSLDGLQLRLSDDRLVGVLQALVAEDMIRYDGRQYSL